MKNRIFKTLALLLCIVFTLSGCNGNGKASYSDNSLNIDLSSDEASFDESSEFTSSGSSASETGSKNTSSKNTSGGNTSGSNSQNSSSEDNTSSEIFPPVSVSGGTVVGTTSKGFEIRVNNGATYIDGVLIVNKTYSLPESYNPGLNSACSKAFNKMKAAAKKDGISMWISSGFRSYKTQKSLYESYCKRDGVAEADRFSARPGHSEHQAGLAIDVNSASSGAYNSVYKNVGEWIAEHCWEYGFILRYPEGKEGITGYKYEPWHIRYVGTELAMKLKDCGLTLEEYFGITSSYATTEAPEDNSSSDETSAESGVGGLLPDNGSDESSSTDASVTAHTSEERDENESDKDEN